MSVDVEEIKSGLPLHFKDETEKSRAFEQYRILADSRNKTLEVRVQSNNFWTTVNGAAISALAYMRDAASLSSEHKSFVLWTLILFRLCVCLSWISYLSNIARQLEAQNKLLIELEKHFPIPLFRNVFSSVQDRPEKPTLTMKEMAIPLLFISGYLFFAIMLFFFRAEAALSVAD